MTQPRIDRHTRPTRHWVLVAVLAAMVGAMFFLPRIPQDPAYHDFADHRPLLGIPNCCDVLSNGPFVFVGVWGLVVTWRGVRGRRAQARELALAARMGGDAGSVGTSGAASAGDSSPFVDPWERWPYTALFAAALLTAFGSAYYHLAPDNERLVWDRLPMTLGFMGLLTAIIAERIGVTIARIVFIPLLIAGAGSVFYWAAGERRGMGDLRPYALVQFGSLAVLVLILMLYPSRRGGFGWLVAALVAYVAAKGLEAADRQVLALGHVVSGHTLKHVAAAVGVGCIVMMLRARR